MDFILSLLLMMVIVCGILSQDPVEFWSTRSSPMIFYFISVWLCFLHRGRVWWWTVTKLPPVGLASRGTRCFCFLCLSAENMYWHCLTPGRHLSGPSFLLVLFSAEKNHSILSLSPLSLLNSLSLYKYWCFSCMQCLCTNASDVCSAYRKMALDSLELELQAIVRHPLIARNWTQILYNSTQYS